MQKRRRCVRFFTLFVFLVYLNPAFCAETSLDLEPIIVSKQKVHLLNSYSLDSELLGDFVFNSPLELLGILPLDLQSRSPKSAIQSDFSLRGSTFQGVLFLLNGQRINDPQTGHHNSDLPFTAEDIQKIEVIPGVSSSLFGPDAIGGAINIILKKPKIKKRVLEMGLGEHQTKGVLFSIADKMDKLGMRLSLENQESGGFSNDTDFKKFTLSLNSLLDLSSGEFGLNLGYQEKEFGAYDFYTPKSGYLSKEWTKTYLLDTGFRLENQDLVIKPNFLWRRHEDKFMLDKTQKRSLSLNHHCTDLVTPNIYFQKESDILGRVGLGLEYGQERINSTNLKDHNREHKSIFLDEAKDLIAGLSLGLSFRWDDFDGFPEIATGSLSCRYGFSKESSAAFAVSRSIRLPSFTELYYSDPTTIGNASLSAEKSLNYQFGYDYKKEELSAGASFFLREEEDFIDWIKRTATQGEKWQAENITESEVSGIEGYLRLPLNEHLKWDANYTYLNRRTTDCSYDYKYGANYIRHLFNNNLIFDLPFGRQSIGFNYKKKPRRDGWLLVNTRLSWNLNKITLLFLEISNLLNVEYQEIEGIPQPGRWVEAGLRLEW